MKLNYKRTILVGFAFFLISAFWQAYDAIVPLMLTNHYGMNQFWSGLVMAMDNILAVFLLPLFGAISDKVASRFGKRTPFIFVGTILAVVMFVSLTFVGNGQLSRVEDTEVVMDYSCAETLKGNVDELAGKIADKDDATLDEIYKNEKAAIDSLYASKTIPEQYEAADSFRDATYKLIKQAKKTSDGGLAEFASAQLKVVDTLFQEIEGSTFEITERNIGSLVGFTLVLLLVLVSMALFRSPAVALMPDVTIKPLRSKGNAIINLMGTAGGIIVLVLGMIFATKRIYMQYTGYVVAVCAVMLVGLVIFLVTVKENKWAKDMQDDTERYGIDESTADEGGEKRRLSRSEMVSLFLILASVALWYIGYNSITSKFSVYATRELGFDHNITLIVAQAAAVVAYIPVGIISSKVGRKKAILAGIVMLTAAFVGGHFITPIVPEIIMYPIFMLAGIGWATINVNSFPMVVELARGGDVGKYTGYYYTASMAAQIVAPTLSGLLYGIFGMRSTFFVFGSVFVALSFVTMLFVKHGDSRPEPTGALESIGAAED